MSEGVNPNPEWVRKGKTIRQLIEELKSFENHDLEVKISVDGGDSFKCISLVGKVNENGSQFCGLKNCE